MYAAENANIRNGVAIVSVLIQQGSDVNAKDENGSTAFDRLCTTSGNAKAAELLVNAGASIIQTIIKDDGHNLTSLMSAALNGHTDLCIDLIEKWHADPRLETAHGGSARSFSESQGHRALSDMIASKIADMHPIV
jgi:ankyrin repeat protein